ncbi:MAG: DUF2062 domain-containing protein [Xanthomonadaceae bacterium]|jgi:uncharacterized protein (DUF2062 family)|nr:DUF2062 domain-containing protein [Xanthomonadaceae bacterium]
MRKEYERHHREHRLRLARVRRLLRPLPRRATLRRWPILGRFADAAKARSWLWSFKVAHVAPALYIGAVCGLLPMPGQVPLGFVLALLLRANLPVVVALCFASNPLTMVPLFTACYVTGHWILDLLVPGEKAFRLSEGLAAMAQGEFGGAWDILAATFLGAVVVGLAAGAVLHGLWLLGAWEARIFKARFQRLRAAMHAQERDPPTGPPGAP